MANGELEIRPVVEKDEGDKEISDNFVVDVQEKPERTIPRTYSRGPRVLTVKLKIPNVLKILVSTVSFLYNE